MVYQGLTPTIKALAVLISTFRGLQDIDTKTLKILSRVITGPLLIICMVQSMRMTCISVSV